MLKASLVAIGLPLAAQAGPVELLRDIAQIAALERLRIATASAETEDFADHLRSEMPLLRARLQALDPVAVSALSQSQDAPAMTAATNVAQVLLEAGSTTDPRARQAGVIAALLLSRGGVADAYEEGAEGEVGGWAIAYQTLARVRDLTAPLLSGLADAPHERVTLALERLTTAIPATPPAYAKMLPASEIEFETQVLASTLLGATGAPGWPATDLAGTARLVQGWAEEACADADAARGQEALAIVAFWHKDALSGPLALFAPAALERAEAAFDAVAEAGVSPDACTALTGALAEARPMVGG